MAEARDLIGEELPDELRRLYRWHSGVEGYRDDASFFPGLFGGPGLSYVGTTELGEVGVVKRLLAAPSYGLDKFQLGDIPLFGDSGGSYDSLGT